MLSGGRGDGVKPDSFKIAIIDTIVAEVQSKPGEDRAILLLGYEAQMREMFQVCAAAYGRTLIAYIPVFSKHRILCV
jgi:hypothetical protein